MRLQILRIDGEHALEFGDRLVEAALEEEHAADLVEHDAIARVLTGGGVQMLDRLVVAPERS